MLSSNYSYLIIIIICLHTVIRFQVLLFNAKKFQTDLFDPNRDNQTGSVVIDKYPSLCLNTNFTKLLLA